jgi:ATP-dependent DNA helicase RecG
MVHGRLKPAERDAEMTRFRDGELDVLVGTTVVEVGVDVPAATMMVVEGADRFGLAQLHQLRGRVGRGTVESFCVLVSVLHRRGGQAPAPRVADTHDGFGRRDEGTSSCRREGDVLGLAQSGFSAPRYRLAADRRAPGSPRSGSSGGETLLDRGRPMDPQRTGALANELGSGWLRRVAAGEPASGADDGRGRGRG